MSYTPEDQRLEEPIANLKRDILEVQEVLRNRINDGADWSEEHLEECRGLILKLTDWEMQLNRRWPWVR